MRTPRIRLARNRARLAAALAGSLALAACLVSAPTSASAVAASEIYPLPATGAFTLDGHGYGHGRGMSQWGAQAAATIRGVNAAQVLDFYYPGTQPTAWPGRSIRVQLENDPPNWTQVDPAAWLTAVDAYSGTYYALPSGPVAWRFTSDAAGFHLQAFTAGAWGPAPGFPDPARGPVAFQAAGPLSSWAADGSRRTYEGVLWLYPTGSGTKVTINTLDLEAYTRAVVPRESPAWFAPEALKAQAVAARSYAAWKIRNAPASSISDICSTTQCQVYGGIRLISAAGQVTELTQPSTDAAVAATAAQVRTYQGLPIFAEFSSSNGGWAMPGSQPYLRGQLDGWAGLQIASGSYVDPHFAWSATLSAAEIQQAFPAVGSLRSLAITSRAGCDSCDWGGRVTGVELRGVDGAGRATSVTTTGAGIMNIKSGAGSGRIRSTWWTVRGAQAATVVPPATPSVSTWGVDGGAVMSWPAPTVGSVASYSVHAWPQAGGVVPGTATSAFVGGLANDSTYQASVTAVGPTGLTATADPVPVVPRRSYAGYQSISPIRVVDPASPLGAGEVRRVQPIAAAGLPATGVTAVVGVLSVRSATRPTFLTTWPGPAPRPATSDLVAIPGDAPSSLATAMLGPDGSFNLRNHDGVAAASFDIIGYYTSARPDARYHDVPAVRVGDSRLTGARLQAGQALRAPLVGPATGAIPADGSPRSVLVAVTVVAPSGWSALEVGPGDGSSRAVAIPTTGRTRVLTLPVPVGADGTVRVVTHSEADVMVDVVGWYGGTTAGAYVPVLPVRVMDTRTSYGLAAAGPITPDRPAAFRVAGFAPVPASGVRAAILNVTALSATVPTHLTAWASGSPRASQADLRFEPGTTATVQVMAPVGADGLVNLAPYVGQVHATADLVGWVTTV